jgi:hypothetical protein
LLLTFLSLQVAVQELLVEIQVALVVAVLAVFSLSHPKHLL